MTCIETKEECLYINVTFSFFTHCNIFESVALKKYELAKEHLMKLGIWLRRIAPILFSVILAACGGGGGSDNSPRLTVSQNNISFSTSQDDYTPPAVSFTAAVSNADQSVYVSVFYSNTGIDSIDYEISGSSGRGIVILASRE